MAGLVAFLTGCSGYKTAVVPGTGNPSQPLDPTAPVLAEGMVAKVHLLSGETLQGEVVSFDSEYLSIGRVGNYGFEETKILLSDIDRVEVESMPKEASLSLGVAGTLMFVFGGDSCLVGDRLRCWGL